MALVRVKINFVILIFNFFPQVSYITKYNYYRLSCNNKRHVFQSATPHVYNISIQGPVIKQVRTCFDHTLTYICVWTNNYINQILPFYTSKINNLQVQWGITRSCIPTHWSSTHAPGMTGLNQCMSSWWKFIHGACKLYWGKFVQ